MSRLTIAFALVGMSAWHAGPASAQIFMPGRRTVVVPRAPSGIARGYTYIAPSYYPRPLWTYDGFFLGYDGSARPGYYWPRPLRMSEMPGSPLNPPPDALPAQRSPFADEPLNRPDPALRPVAPSSAAARSRALDLQAEGDHYLRQQRYHHAYSVYRQALNLADDLAALHLRSGIVFAMLGRYDRAALEFRRATHIDPELPRSPFTLESLFGPDSQLVRASVLSRVSEWVGDDVTDPDRQYILGVLLHFNQDERAQELFSSAFRLTNGADHIVTFLPRAETNDPNAANQPESDQSLLPPAPPPRETGVDAPPQPGLEEDPSPRKVKQPPAKAAPPSSPSEGESEESTSIDGPILLPPSPK